MFGGYAAPWAAWGVDRVVLASRGRRTLSASDVAGLAGLGAGERQQSPCSTAYHGVGGSRTATNLTPQDRCEYEGAVAGRT